MSETFEKLKVLLASQGKLSHDDIETMSAAHGALTPEEIVWLSAEQHDKERSGATLPTMDEYLAASKVLDTAPEGSDEYKRAEAIVTAFEQGG